jgi:hypothetical protein
MKLCSIFSHSARKVGGGVHGKYNVRGTGPCEGVALWEADGSMEGCADEYWQKARRLVEEESAGADSADAAQDAA